MSALVAIDPGFSARGEGSAVACFVAGYLFRVHFDRPQHAVHLSRLLESSRVIWECPQVDARSRTIAPTLVRLAAEGGMLAGIYAGMLGCAPEAVPPAAWKASTPKPVHHGRIWLLLEDDERALLGGAETLAAIETAKRKGALDRWSKPGASYYPRRWLTHNLLDAVGLGLWALGRIK